MRRALQCLCTSALISLAAIASAQEPFPSRPVKLIVPVAAGGGIDTAFRAIAPAWSELLGQQVVVENKPGGGQVLGSDLVAKAKPDGYTLLAAGVPIAFNTALGRKLPYDAIKDFTPLSLVVSQPLLIVVNPAVPVKSMGELVAYAKAQKQPLQYTTGGIGSYGHLWWEMFRARQGIEGEHVAYNGIAPALKDVMGGQVTMTFDNITTAWTLAKAGKLRALAVTTAKRSSIAPDVPTLAESGLPGFEVGSWQGVFAPAGTPPAIVKRLNAEIVKALNLPDVREKLGALGAEIVADSPEEFSALVKSEVVKWSDVVKKSGAKVD